MAPAVIVSALRPVSHIAAWLVWHSTRISLLEDLDAPGPVGDDNASPALARVARLELRSSR